MEFLRSLKAGFSSGVTTVFGGISIICGAGTLLGLIPAPFSAIAMGVCGIANGLGLVAAPDASKVEQKK